MVSRDFDPFPWGRTKGDDPNSCGEAFRDDLLVPALERCETVIIDFSGTIGVGSSWLDEVFGKLVFKNGWSEDEFRKKIIINSSEIPTTKLVALKCVKDSIARRLEKTQRGTLGR